MYKGSARLIVGWHCSLEWNLIPNPKVIDKSRAVNEVSARRKDLLDPLQKRFGRKRL
jgi:hypothetical protein